MTQETFERRIQRKNPLTSILSDAGKLQPQAVDLEESVLGAVMLDKDAIVLVSEILQPDSFYKDEHKEIFQACLTLFQTSQPIDLLTVTNQLRHEGKLESSGGAYYLSELTNKVSTAANLDYYSRIVAQKYILRRLIELTSTIQRDCYDETIDVFDILTDAQVGLNKTTDSISLSNIQTIGEISTEANKSISRSRQTGEVTGLSTGQKNLDIVLKGMGPGDLIIIAGRPGMGKTSEALCIVHFLSVLQRRPGGFLSMEMSSSQLCISLYSIDSQIDNNRIKRGDFHHDEGEKWNQTLANFDKAPLYIDDTGGLNILKIKVVLVKMKIKYNIEYAVIDFLQLAHGLDKKQSRAQQVEEISRELKSLAKELQIPIIALSQLSRAVEMRGGDKRPQLSDLKESGAIEEAADKVIFVYRPEYYNITTDADGHSTAGVAEMIIAKNRGGATDTAFLEWQGNTTTFRDPNDSPFTPNFKPVVNYENEPPY